MTTTIEDDGLRAPIDEPALFAAWTEYRKHLPTGMGPEAMPKAMATVLAASIQAYLAALRSSPAVDGVGEPVAWMLRSYLRDGTPVLRLPMLPTREEAERYQQRNPDETLVPLYDSSPTSDRASVVEAASEWAVARAATLAEPVADVRTSETFRVALNRLSSAEEALVAAVAALSTRSS